MISGAIVLYNTPKQNIEQAIISFAPSKDRLLFLIDNSESKTEEYEGRQHIIYIHNDRNIGYGAANNIGIRLAIDKRVKYHVIMNPDISFEPSVIDALAAYADQNEDVVEIMPKVLAPDGEEQFLAKLLPTPMNVFTRRFMSGTKLAKHLDNKYTLRELDHTKIINAPFLSGCFMFLRVSALTDNSLLFDERYFLYFEDCDFVRRAHRVGKTIYYPYVSITHSHKRDSYKSSKMLRVHISSTIKYFCKYGWFLDRERKAVNREVYS